MGKHRTETHGSRQQAAYERQRAAHLRNAEASRRLAAERSERERIAAAEHVLFLRWGGRKSALDSLSRISRELEKLRRAEENHLAERDLLIESLRAADYPWTTLESRTGLSRQALSKRRP